MVRRSRKKRAAVMDRSIGILLIFVGVVLIGLLAGAAWWLKRSRPAVDAETNCPVSGPQIVHALMFDRSDPISGQQAQRIKFAVNELKRTAAFGYRFDIYTFEGDAKNVLLPVLQICSPGKPEDANELYQNPDLVRRRYEERFSSVLDTNKRPLARVDPARFSNNRKLARRRADFLWSGGREPNQVETNNDIGHGSA
jgi:hypothetical protein